MNLLKHFKQFGIILVLVITCINPAFTQLNFWQQTNGPYGGDIRWMMAADSGRLYVWTNSFNGIGKGELSYSKDAGKNWELVEYPGEVILALCRTSHGKIVIATDNGLFRSDSNGAVWVSIADSLPLNSYIYHISEADDDLFAVINNYGLYKCSNNKNYWSLINTNDTVFSFSCIVADTTGTLIAGGWLGVFASTDSGRTWISKNTGLEQTNLIVETMTIDKNSTLYVSFNTGGFFSSTDHGTTWKKNGTLGHFDSFIVNPLDGKFFAGYGEKVIFSTDSGSTWHLVTGKNLGSNIRYIALDSGNILYGATGRGTIYSSTDYGESWFTSGLSNKYISAIAVGSNGTVYAGAIDYGLSMSKDNGNHWQAINSGLPGPINLNSLLTVSDQLLFAGTKSGLYRTKPDTLHWELVGGGFQPYSVTALAKLNDTVLFAGCSNGAFYGSTDGGNAWKMIAIFPKAIFDIIPGDNGKIFAGGAGGVSKSIDSGKTWSNINMASLLEGGYVGAMAVAPNKTIFAAGMDALLRSTDDGSTWTPVLGRDGMRISISALIITKTGTIYTSGDSTYCSTDNGQTWESTNIYPPNCYSLSDDGLLYAGSWYGVFSTQPKVMGVNPSEHEALATTFALSQNYPNPFNPTTTIRFTVPFNSFVTLTIYDIMGREIERLVAEERHAGTYTVKFNPKNLSSGMYFYRLQSGAFSETKKLLLLK